MSRRASTCYSRSISDAYLTPMIILQTSLSTSRRLLRLTAFSRSYCRMKALVVILLAATGAFAQKIQTEFDRTANFSQFKTFAIRPGRLASGNPSLNNDLVKKQLEADIQKHLEAKGLTPISSGKPDLDVRYTLGTPRGVETEVYPAGWRGWGSRVVKVPYTEGTLVIDLRDSGRNSLIWRAIAREDQQDASKLASKLDDMVKKAIDKYPPKAK